MKRPEDDVEEAGSTSPFANVVTFGRKSHGEVVPYEPPPETPREAIAAKKRDIDALNLLDEVREHFEEGDYHGLVLLAGKFDDAGNLIDVVCIINDRASSYPLAFTGAVEDLKTTLLDMRQLSDGEGSILREADVWIDDEGDY